MKSHSVRRRLLGSAAIGLGCLGGAAGLAGQASAQSVTCSATGTAINCLDGASIVATGTADGTTAVTSGPGLVASDPDSMTVSVTATAPFQTDLAGEDAVNLVATDNLELVFNGNISTMGATSNAVSVSAGTDATVTVGNVAATGPLSSGVTVLSGGEAILSAGNVSTTDGPAVYVAGASTDVSLGNVTAGGSSFAIANYASTGDASTVCGDVSAGGGYGVTTNSTATTTVSCGNIAVVGGSSALFATGADIILDTGNLSTTGSSAIAAPLTGTNSVVGTIGNISTQASFSGGLMVFAPTIDLTVGDITTDGDFATGAFIQGDSVTFDAGDVLTDGLASNGVYTAASFANSTTVGDIVTLGDSSVGLQASSGTTNTVTAGNVVTSGLGSFGVLTGAGTESVVNVGDIITQGFFSWGIQTGAGTSNATTVGNVATSGDDSPAVQIFAGTDVTAVVGDVTTFGNSSTAVFTVGGAGNSTVVGDVSTEGANAFGVAASGATVDLAAGDVATAGDFSTSVSVSAPGAIAVAVGDVTTLGLAADGVNVIGDSGAVVVTTGVVDVAGEFATAVGVQTSSGSQTITVSGASVAGVGMDAIRATSTSGNIDFTAAGDVDAVDGNGIAVNTGGTSAIDVAAGADVSGSAAGINSVATGGSIITIAGSVSSSAGLAVNADGGIATLNVATGGDLSGAINLTDNADVVNVDGTWNASGTSDFGAGIDTLNNNSNTINTVDGTVFDNLEIFNNNANGLLNLGTGTTSFPDTTTFNNAGTIRAFGGLTTLTSLAPVANSGLVDLVDGAANDILTITNNYVGSGAGSLAVDYSGTAIDRLVIGGAASGTTTLNVSPTDDIVINTAGVLVVESGTTTLNTFILGTANVGLIDLSLAQVGQDYFLSSVPNIAAIEPVVVGELASNLWYQSADIYSNYAALRRSDLGINRTSNFGFWGQAYLSRDKVGGQDVSAFGLDFDIGRVETKRRGIQAGIDYAVGTSSAVGLTGGYERAEANMRNSASDFRANGYNIGAYAMFGSGSGFYGDLLVKHDKANLHFDNSLFDDVVGNPDINSFGVQGQVGYRFVSGSVNFDLGAGLAQVKSKIDDFAVGSIVFDFDSVKSLRGHLGGRVGFGNGAFAPFLDAKLFHEFKDKRDLKLPSGTSFDAIEGEARGTWGRIEAGIGALNGSGPILAVWGDLGDVKGFGMKAGWRFGGRPVEAVAPPPPPPPQAPPPPATQTCPDGSVILATGACPTPPPPPPPPPPEPERG